MYKSILRLSVSRVLASIVVGRPRTRAGSTKFLPFASRMQPKEQTRSGGSIFTFKAPPDPHKTVQPAGDKVFRCSRLWGTFLIKPPYALILQRKGLVLHS